MSGRSNDNDLVYRIKNIIPYLNGEYENSGRKKMQNTRYLILLYGATMIDEFNQKGTKHGRILYFSYNQLNYISKSPLINRPILFESTRTSRTVYPDLQRKEYVRIEKIHFEYGGYGEGVAIIRKGIDIARKRLSEIENGFLHIDENLRKCQNHGLNWLSSDDFESHKNIDNDFDNWKKGFDLPSIKAKKELRREGLISDIKNKLENRGKLLMVGQSGISKTTTLMELMCDYFDAGYEVLYNYGTMDIRNVDGLVTFVEDILRMDKNILVAVDNVHREETYSIFYFIDKLSHSPLGRKLKIILTARTPEFDWLLKGHENIEEKIRKSIEKLCAERNFIYQLPYFTKEEVKELIKRYLRRKVVGKITEEIYSSTKGDPVMVKFSILDRRLEQDVAKISGHYLRSPTERKAMLICSILEISDTEITDTLLEKCGILETVHNLDGSVLHNSDGSWKTEGQRWVLKLFSFFFNNKSGTQLEERKQDLKDSLIALYNLREEKITYSAIKALHYIVDKNFVPKAVVESVFRQSRSQVPNQTFFVYFHVSDARSITDAYYRLKDYIEVHYLDKLAKGSGALLRFARL